MNTVTTSNCLGLGLLTLALLQVGCDSGAASAPSSPSAVQPASTSPVSATPRVESPTAEELALIGSYLAAYNTGDSRVVDDVIDHGYLFDRIVAGLPPDQLPARETLAGMRAGFVTPDSRPPLLFVLDEANNSLQPGGLKLLASWRSGESLHILLRAIGPRWSTPQYQELVLDRDTAGQVRFVDQRNLLTNEWESDAIRGLLARPMEGADDLGEIRSAAEHPDAAEAVRRIEALPLKAKQDEKLAALCLGVIAARGTREQFETRLDEFRQLHPQSLLGTYHQINRLMLTGKWADVLPLIDEIMPLKADDPFLDVVRANICMRMGALDDAETYGRRALTAEPQLPEAYDCLTRLAVRRNDIPGAVEWLKSAAKKFPHITPYVRHDPDLHEIADSIEYREWRPTEHASQAKPSTGGTFDPTREDRPAE